MQGRKNVPVLSLLTLRSALTFSQQQLYFRGNNPVDDEVLGLGLHVSLAATQLGAAHR